MRVSIEITNIIIKDLILEHIKSRLGPEASIAGEDIIIRVRSKQNYKNHEWEIGELNVKYEGDI